MKALESTQEQEARELRRKIQAIRIKRLGWSEYVFHYIMDGLGFGKSLRALSFEDLSRLYEIISGYRKPRDPGFEYDKSGKYMYHLQKEAGWSDLFLRQFLTLTYSKTHWNLLTSSERANLINILKQNIEANQKNQGKEN